MVMAGDKSYAVKDLLRSMLHAWYDLSKGETGAWTTQLEAEIALQQAMEKPEQLTKLICEVLFHAWRQHATNPVVREMRKSHPASRVAWVQRMVAPKKPRLRPGVGKVKAEGESGGQKSDFRQEADVGITVSSSQETSARRSGRRHQPFRSRYLRVQTILPDTIRYGRSPAIPAPPSLDPPQEKATDCIASAATGRGEALRFPDGSSVAVDGSFSPGETPLRNETVDPDRACARRESLVCTGVAADASMDPSNLAPRLPSRPPASATLYGVEGSNIGYKACSCSPSLTWEELEPWEQRNPRREWMMPSPDDEVGRRRRAGRSRVAMRKEAEVVSDSNEVFEKVTGRLDHLRNIDQRQQKATALLLLLSDGKGSPDRSLDLCSGTRNGDCMFPATGVRRRRRRKVMESTSGWAAFSCGSPEGSRDTRNRTGYITRSSRKSDGCGDSGRSEMRSAGGGNGCDALQGITPSVRFAVGRDIARVRMGRRRMSDARSPCGQHTAEEARRVMFGFSPQLGRYSDREDRWL
ncbi:unnamed protein product [Scytosiphon promiscuus]